MQLPAASGQRPEARSLLVVGTWLLQAMMAIILN
jgi:hypothetical protein